MLSYTLFFVTVVVAVAVVAVAVVAVAVVAVAVVAVAAGSYVDSVPGSVLAYASGNSSCEGAHHVQMGGTVLTIARGYRKFHYQAIVKVKFQHYSRAMFIRA